jgi:hypothetical protein
MGRTRDVSKILTSNTSILSLASASSIYQTKASNALVLLGTTSFTAESTVSIDNVFSATYENYRVLGNLSLSNNTASLLFRYRNNGSDETGGTYTGGFVRFVGGTGSFGTGTGTSNQTSATLSLNISTETAVSFSFDVMTPDVLASTPIFGFSKRRTANADFFNYSYYYQDSYDGFSIFPSAGNITGSIVTYGYNK